MAGGRGPAAQAACWEGPTAGLAGRARAERTRNMVSMVLTLDVSKFSDWLNADALCRVEREASEEGRRAGRQKAVGGQRRCKQRAGRTQLWRLLAGHASSARKTWTTWS